MQQTPASFRSRCGTRMTCRSASSFAGNQPDRCARFSGHTGNTSSFVAPSGTGMCSMRHRSHLSDTLRGRGDDTASSGFGDEDRSRARWIVFSVFPRADQEMLHLGTAETARAYFRGVDDDARQLFAGAWREARHSLAFDERDPQIPVDVERHAVGRTNLLLKLEDRPSALDIKLSVFGAVIERVNAKRTGIGVVHGVAVPDDAVGDRHVSQHLLERVPDESVESRDRTLFVDRHGAEPQPAARVDLSIVETHPSGF